MRFGLYDERRQKILESQTSQDGRIIFSGLLPGKYWLKEEKTGNGQQLLKEPMEIVLPMVLTEQDVEKLKLIKVSWSMMKISRYLNCMTEFLRYQMQEI